MSGKITYVDPLLGAPAWAQDYFDPDDAIVRYPAVLDPVQFEDVKSVNVVLTANKAIGQTSLAVTALSGPIPAGTNLHFGGGLAAVTSAAAAKGATAVTVIALTAALTSGQNAWYRPFGTRKQIPSGTLVGRTFAERDAGTAFGPAVYTDDEFYIVVRPLVDATKNADIEMYKPGRHVKENYLPDWATISANANLLAKLRAVYITLKGVN